MRILHTADWHLADRLRHIDRSRDIGRAVEQVAEYCEQLAVDVLLIAGDLLSDLARPDLLQAAIAHLSHVFRPFLMGGGTMVALTGNHDNETFCQTLHRAFQLAAPVDVRQGGLLSGGRLYLAVRPATFRIADRGGQEVQFTCMPYPTPARYLGNQQATSIEHKHQLLRSAFLTRLRRIRNRLRADLPQVLAAHISVAGADWPVLFRVTDNEDIVIPDPEVCSGWHYVALGHLHRPQLVRGKSRVRYAGSIERLDMGERHDCKGVVLAEINGSGAATDPVVMPLETTPFYNVVIQNPRHEIPRLRARYPLAAEALVRCRVYYRPGFDNLPAILADLSRTFPRCYERSWSRIPEARSGPVAAPAVAAAVDDTDSTWAGDIALAGESVAHTVLSYLRGRLADDDPDREELLALAEQLLENDS